MARIQTRSSHPRVSIVKLFMLEPLQLLVASVARNKFTVTRLLIGRYHRGTGKPAVSKSAVRRASAGGRGDHHREHPADPSHQ